MPHSRTKWVRGARFLIAALVASISVPTATSAHLLKSPTLPPIAGSVSAIQTSSAWVVNGIQRQYKGSKSIVIGVTWKFVHSSTDVWEMYVEQTQHNAITFQEATTPQRQCYRFSSKALWTCQMAQSTNTLAATIPLTIPTLTWKVSKVHKVASCICRVYSSYTYTVWIDVQHNRPYRFQQVATTSGNKPAGQLAGTFSQWNDPAVAASLPSIQGLKPNN